MEPDLQPLRHLSILYLRCVERVKGWGFSEERATFNSLFEMHQAVSAVVLLPRGPFNSLFEMRTMRGARRDSYHRLFQFSI